ncbi:MAG: NAD(P)-dependent oxidoreductase [Armatimonadetes bacterium]|nr:NAD(P)-dependent oxidoreductase [Armatimonadota bacterium]
MSTVALFGGSGKIGRGILGVLKRRGLGVRALVHRTPLDAAQVTSVSGSITDPRAVREVVRGAEYVVHLATTKEDPETFFEVSARGTFNVLEACREEGVKQLILLGGDAVFGIWFYPQPIPIGESHPYTAYPGYYAFSKVVEEVMAQQYQVQYGLPVTILRSSWVFEADDLLRHFSLLENVDPAEPGHGFGDVGEEALRLVRAGEERIPILLDAQGTPLRRHIVHLDDVLQAFERMLGLPEAVGQSFNIAGPAAFNYRVAAGHLADHIGLPTIELPCPAYHSFEIDISRARSILGYAPANGIFAMIDRAVACRQETRSPEHA